MKTSDFIITILLVIIGCLTTWLIINTALHDVENHKVKGYYHYTFVDEVYGDTLHIRDNNPREAIEYLYKYTKDDSYLRRIK